jgi:hypothetical protein
VAAEKASAPSPLFCPHARRCFRCDRWSCEEPACRVYCLDGGGVAELVESTRPDVLFLDFDQVR